MSSAGVVIRITFAHFARWPCHACHTVAVGLFVGFNEHQPKSFGDRLEVGVIVRAQWISARAINQEPRERILVELKSKDRAALARAEALTLFSERRGVHPARLIRAAP